MDKPCKKTLVLFSKKICFILKKILNYSSIKILDHFIYFGKKSENFFLNLNGKLGQPCNSSLASI